MSTQPVKWEISVRKDSFSVKESLKMSVSFCGITIQWTIHKLMSLWDPNKHQHTQRSTYPFENVKIDKSWGQEEDQRNIKI